MKQDKLVYGLMGYPLSHSFSQQYFTEKFKSLNLPGRSYKLFPMDSIMQFPDLIMRNPNLVGLNVTVPYKKDILNFLDQIDHVAADVGAVNTIKIRQTPGDIIVKGYNTDVYGFEQTLLNFLPEQALKCLVFGNGGAALAVKYVLQKLNIPFLVVSRTPGTNTLLYNDLTPEIYDEYKIWVNTTPVGMYPNTDDMLPLDFGALTPEHYIYDLIYNPELTRLLNEGIAHGAKIKNGLEMLHLQADRSFEIWDDVKYK